jgi:multidrug transporter EmrE-like cation transporter
MEIGGFLLDHEFEEVVERHGSAFPLKNRISFRRTRRNACRGEISLTPRDEGRWRNTSNAGMSRCFMEEGYSRHFSIADWMSRRFSALIFGSYLSLMLWMGGMKYAKVSVAAVLNQLNTIFIVIIASVVLKERLTVWKVAEFVIALVGAYLSSMLF